MKWTMISVALLGLATYGVIFFAQLQHEPAPQATTAPTAATIDPPAPVDPAPATLAEVGVSEEESADPVDAPGWTGDPWTAGVEAFEARDDELAVRALRAAVAEREQSGYRHYVLGLALRRTGETEDAVIELERSLELAPASQKSWIALARCELDRGETTAARAAVDAALELDLESADAWHVLGRVELAEGALEHADAAFSRALDHDPAHAWAANNLGYVRILQERFDEAVAPLQTAVADDPDEPVFLNNLGTALERTGHAELAALAFAHAARLGHGPAELSMERVEDRLAAAGAAYAAADSAAVVDAPQLLARVGEAFAAVASGDEDPAVADAELVAANESGELRQ